MAELRGDQSLAFQSSLAGWPPPKGRSLPRIGLVPAPQGTSGNNGDVIGYTYSDAINPTLSHSALYVYDSLNRLTCAQATGSSTYNLTFNYDRFGNMSCVTNAQTNGPCPNWTFNAATNRISTPGWSYDVAGEVTSDAIHADQWDAEGRMKSVDNVNQTLPCPSYAAACMTFNALGQRVEMQLPSAGGWRYEYLYDPWGHEHGSYDGAGNTWGERNILLGQRQIAVYYGGYTRLLHPNHLGSTLQVSYGTGANAQDELYYPWGQQWRQAGTAEDLHFAGFEQHEYLDFYPTLNRKYNSTHGRWLSPDPGGLKVVRLDDPQTWNMYAYVRNNPTTLTDPTGLEVPASCAKDPKCTIVVKVNVIYDQTVNRGKGLTPEQKEKFQSEQLAKAQKDYGTSNIKLDVTYTAGRFDVGANGNPVITGTRSGYLNLVVSNGTSSGAAGESFVDRRSGIAVSIVNINDAGEHNFYPLSMNTTEHEIGHQFLGHVYMGAGGFWDTFSKEFGVDNRLFGQTLGVSQGAFRVGLEPRDYASPADGPDQ